MSGADEGAFARRERKVWIIVALALALILLVVLAIRLDGGREAQSPPEAVEATPLLAETNDAESGSSSDEAEPEIAPIASAEPPPPHYDHDPVDRYIEFRTDDAERIVRGFRISCPQEGKSIALMDVLREAARQGSYKGAHLYTTVDSRGGEVRIYHQMRTDKGQSNPPHVVMSLNEWGDLQLYDIREEAVMNLCYF